MPEPARMTEHDPVRLVAGELRFSSGPCLAVTTADGDFMARRAAGCLLAPRPGDRVLVAATGLEAFVLSVLTRPEGSSDAEVDVPGTMTLRAGGDIRFLADGDMTAAAGRDMTLTACTAEARFEQASLWVKSLRTTARCLSVVAASIEQVAGSLTQRLRNAVRLVAEHEEVQAGSSRYLVEKTLTMHSKNAVHVAEEVVKIDAGQVHLG